ncbi:CopG family transcriptional regulator [Salinimicrobium sp. CDJ15-81-2]|uniref:CopG family transcriptional regulator n=1 Tax=Tamlana crocina TaxID=393006 RepID=A0ABX1DKV6_9FLAO|nr:type II toxin-antitoxin system ParD family antitoxin [Tamlana crocina]NJX16891.1 CopG family transcriptional regulator [Tamlana crocina]NJY63593.1 CopG family transcriptional regulator [Salinimicrobium nanhaiense]
MTRQSISLTEPNDEWLKEQLRQEEYSSKSELINDLIRKEREKQKEIEWLRMKLIEGEKSGFTNLSAEEILAQSKDQLRSNGKL